MINNNSESSPAAGSSGHRYHHFECMALACGESGSLNIISELNSLYEDRVKKIENKTVHSTTDPLVHTLKSWVTDLNVQNNELVHALEDLERETACRVELLEEKFKGTSIATQEYMAKAQDYNNQMWTAPSGSAQAGVDSTQIDHLKSDLRNLCRLIQQGRENEDWSTDDFIFFEVTLEEIFGTYPIELKKTKANVNTSASQGQEDGYCCDANQQLAERTKALEALQEQLNKLNEEMQLKDAQLKKLGLELSEFNRTRENIDGELTDRNSVIGSLETDLKTMREHMALKDEQIMSLIQKIQELRDDLQEKSCTVNTLLQKSTGVSQMQTMREQRKIDDQQNEILILSRQLQETEYRLDYVLGDKQQLTDNLSSVHRELNIKKQEVEALTNAITDIDKCAKDKQAALTGEVADKHDQISQIKRECQQLEDRCRQADMQIIFKDGIIKEMRKELKLCRIKVLPQGDSRGKSKSQIPESTSAEFFGKNVATDEMKEEMNNLVAVLKARDEKISQQEIIIEELQRDLNTNQVYLPVSGSSAVNGTNGEKPKPSLRSAMSDTSKLEVHAGVTHTRVNFSCGDMICLSTDNPNDCYKGLESSMQQVEDMTLMLEAREGEIFQKNALIVRLKSLLRLAHLGLRKVANPTPGKCSIATKLRCHGSAQCPKILPKEDIKPPKVLRSSSIEEFRVKTVEAQAAIEDMMEEMETLLSNLNERENRFNELERIIETLQQTLYKNRQEMSELENETNSCNGEKQAPLISLEEKALQILQLKESLDKSFKSLSSYPDQGRSEHYQLAAKEFQLAMDKIMCELMAIMQAVLSREKQVVFKQDVIRDVKESLAQIQSHMGHVQTELVSYLKVKEKTEESRKESERKMEKWQTELESAQDELRDNVEQYAATEYASQKLVQMSGKERPPSRSPLIRNYVYRGSDNDVRRTIEELKEQIDILVDELEVFDDYHEASEQKVKELQEKLDGFQSKVDSSEHCAIGDLSEDPDCNCGDEDPGLQGDPLEILQDTLQSTDCELEQIQRDIEELLSDDSDYGTSPAKELLALIGEHTAIVDELNSRSKKLQGALDKARSQIRTMTVDKKSANQLPSKKEEVVLTEYCMKTLQLEEELERSRAQVKSIQGDLKSKEALAENQTKNCRCSEKYLPPPQSAHANQYKGDLCCQPESQTGETGKIEKVEELEQQVAHQQVTIGNLQKALLSTKQQLEDLQGRGSFEVDCVAALKSRVERLQSDLEHIMMENSSLYDELQQKDEILRKMAIINQERTILQRELQEELSKTTTLVKMQQHLQIIHKTTRNFKINLSKKVKAICMNNINSPKNVCQCQNRLGQHGAEDSSRQLEQKIVDLEAQLNDEERLNDENAEKLGELQHTVDSQALEIKNWKLSLNKLQKSYDSVLHCGQEKEQTMKKLKQEICELRSSSANCKCSTLVSKLQQRDEQVQSLQQEIENLKGRTNLCKCIILKAQLHQKGEELERVARQISELRSKVSACTCRSMSCQLKSKEAELNQQKKEITELRQRLVACRCASRCKAIEQEKMILSMQDSLKKMESIIRQKDEEYNAAQNQFYEQKREMEVQLCELMNSTEEMRTTCSCKKNKAALIEAVEREAELQTKFTEHDRQLQAEMREMHTLEMQLSDEVEALNGQVQNLECELQRESCQVGRLRGENQEMQIELKDGREQIMKLYEALSKAKSCLIEANNRLERSDIEIDHLRSLLSSFEDKNNCADGNADGKLTNMLQEVTNLKCEITRLVQVREKTNAEVASLQEAYQYLIYEFNCKSQSVVKLRSILSKVSFADSQDTVVVCSMQRGDCLPKAQDMLAEKHVNPHNEIKKLCRTKELMSNAINKLICDNTNLRRKLRARTMSQNNDWPLLSYPRKVLEIQKDDKISTTSRSSSRSSNKDHSDSSTPTECTNLPDEEVSNHSSCDSCEYSESSETYMPFDS